MFTGRHLPYGITHGACHPTQVNVSCLIPAGTRFPDLGGMILQ